MDDVYKLIFSLLARDVHLGGKSGRLVVLGGEEWLTEIDEGLIKQHELGLLDAQRVIDSLYSFPSYNVERCLQNLGLFKSVSRSIRLQGSFDPVRLRAAVDALVRRHDIFRAAYSRFDTRYIVNFQAKVVDPLTIYDLTLEEEAVGILSRKINELQRAGFRLEQFPLFGFHLFKINQNDYVLSFIADHRVADGASIDVIFSELRKLYTKPEDRLPAALQYSAYSAWQRIWLRSEGKEALAALLTDVVAFQDRQRPGSFTSDEFYVSKQHPFTLPNITPRLLLKVQIKHSVSPFMLVLGGYVLALSAMMGTDDLLISTTFSNRDKAISNTTVGFLANPTPLMFTINPTMSVSGFLSYVQKICLSGMDRSRIPFLAVANAASEVGVESKVLLQYGFNFDYYLAEREVGPWPKDHTSHQFSPQSDVPTAMTWSSKLYFMPLLTDLGLRGSLIYGTDFFSSRQCESLLKHLSLYISSMVLSSDVPLSELIQRLSSKHAEGDC